MIEKSNVYDLSAQGVQCDPAGSSSIYRKPAQGRIVGSRPPLVKAGTYEVVYARHKSSLMFGNSPKIEVWFRIVTPGEFFGMELPRYYNALKLRRGGGFDVARGSDYTVEYARCLESEFVLRGFNPPDSIRRFTLKARVREISTIRGQALPKLLQYSVIGKLEGRA